MPTRQSLDHHLATLLDVDRFQDYGPNGLQVEGRAEISHLVCGVTASLALIDAAIEARADAAYGARVRLDGLGLQTFELEVLEMCLVLLAEVRLR